MMGARVWGVAALNLPVDEVGVVAPEHAVDAGVDLLGHVARALRGLDHQVGALHLWEQNCVKQAGGAFKTMT